MDIKTIEKPTEVIDKIKSSKWTNLYFIKTGKCYKGEYIYNTEEEATNAYKEVMGNNIPKIRFRLHDNIIIVKTTVAYIIPMPVKE